MYSVETRDMMVNEQRDLAGSADCIHATLVGNTSSPQCVSMSWRWHFLRATYRSVEMGWDGMGHVTARHGASFG